MKNTVTMDSMLRFLDSQKLRVAAFVTEQEGPWFDGLVSGQLDAAKERYSLFADRVESNIRSLIVDRATEAKGLAIAAALREVRFPAFPENALVPPAVRGRWHASVCAAPADGMPDTRHARKVLGTVDYEMTVTRTRPRLNVDNYEERLRLGVHGCILSFDDESPEERLARTRADFVKFVQEVDLKAFAELHRLRWVIAETDCSTTLRFVCIPAIKSVSEEIRRLRKFEENLPKGTVYACIADPEEAATLCEQGYGTLIFPSGEITGWSFKRSPRIDEHDLLCADVRQFHALA